MTKVHSLSSTELKRATMLQRILNKTITQREAADSLGITDRHMRRLVAQYRAEGAAGLGHQARGRPSNNHVSQALKDEAITLVRSNYPDFGPTLAAEKLAERDGVKIGTETLRKLMIAEGIWHEKQRKPTHRTRRERRACYGDMAQFDGCRHDWFEGRRLHGTWATLLASRDDATNTVVAQFVAYEGTRPVMQFWWDYFTAHGKPASIYLDRHSTYKVNSKNALDDNTMVSQFERAMQEMNVTIIHANSPQAKGRIENLFGTLQDRLVKELRLANINDVTTANTFLNTTFLPSFNARFCVEPQVAVDIHSPLQTNENMAAILSIQSERYVNKDFTIRFKNQWLQLTKIQPTLVLPGSLVTVEERLDTSLHIRINGHYLQYETHGTKPATPKQQPIALTSNPNTPGHHSGNSNSHIVTKPSPTHPWRKFTLLPYNISNRPNQKRPSKKRS